MTIGQIKKLTAETAPYYFDKKTLDFFGQKMKVLRWASAKTDDTKYLRQLKHLGHARWNINTLL